MNKSYFTIYKTYLCELPREHAHHEHFTRAARLLSGDVLGPHVALTRDTCLVRGADGVLWLVQRGLHERQKEYHRYVVVQRRNAMLTNDRELAETWDGRHDNFSLALFRRHNELLYLQDGYGSHERLPDGVEQPSWCSHVRKFYNSGLGEAGPLFGPLSSRVEPEPI